MFFRNGYTHIYPDSGKTFHRTTEFFYFLYGWNGFSENRTSRCVFMKSS